jgi:hypothetical protein
MTTLCIYLSTILIDGNLDILKSDGIDIVLIVAEMYAWYWVWASSMKFTKVLIEICCTHSEWRVGLSDTIMKGNHPMTIPAKFYLVQWFQKVIRICNIFDELFWSWRILFSWQWKNKYCIICVNKLSFIGLMEANHLWMF